MGAEVAHGVSIVQQAPSLQLDAEDETPQQEQVVAPQEAEPVGAIEAHEPLRPATPLLTTPLPVTPLLATPLPATPIPVKPSPTKAPARPTTAAQEEEEEEEEESSDEDEVLFRVIFLLL